MDDAVLAAFADAVVDRAVRLAPGMVLRPATASANSLRGQDGDPRDRLYVVVDGDDQATPCTSLIGPVAADDRVNVMFVPPQGAVVVGWVALPDRFRSEGWHYVGEVGEPAFETGWGNHATPGDWGPAGFRRHGIQVRMAGLIRRLSGAGTSIVALPGQYAPPHNRTFVCQAGNGSARVDVSTAGTVSCPDEDVGGGGDVDSATGGWLVLDQISYDLDS